MRQKNHYRVAVAVALVLAVTASLWFTAPVKALTTSFPTLPSSGTLGSTYQFTVKVEVEDRDCLPIRSVDLYIYKSDNRTTYEAHCDNLPLSTLTSPPYTTITATGTSGTCGTVSITATAATGWGYGYGYRYGYGYAEPGGYGYHYFGYGYGYGYGNSPYVGATSITYDVTWTSPSSWPTGGYKIQVKVKANSKYFTQTSSEFTLSAPAGGGGAPVTPSVEEGVTDVSDVITDEGVFTEDATVESEDALCELLIEEDTVGLTEDGEPLSEISIVEMEDPPARPEDSSVIGLVYDFGPDGATFEPPITLTFTYDESLIPEGVTEENLVIAMWDEEAGEWVELSPCTVDPVTHTITAPVSHFTAFTVLAYTRPAAFAASDLSISPAEVNIGETVTISVLVANAGDLTGSYEVTLKIDNVVVATEEVTLAGGASQEVTFTTSKDITGTYAVDVNGLTGTFEVRAAAFVLSDLTISPTEVKPGETVNISATIANIGETEGSYTVTLKIDGAIETTKEVTLIGGQSTTVTFAVTRDLPGSYEVEADGLIGSFTVTKLINWWLIGGIIAACIIVGVVIWLAVRRRRA